MKSIYNKSKADIVNLKNDSRLLQNERDETKQKEKYLNQVNIDLKTQNEVLINNLSK